MKNFTNFMVLAIFSLAVSCQKTTEQAPSKPDIEDFEAISLLGDSLFRPQLSPQVELDFKKKLEDTRLMHKANSKEVTNIVWYGRRLAYMGQFNKAQKIYTAGLQENPNSFHILRHRGHRYVTLREFDRAVADLSRAAVLSSGTELEIEPDGLPNRLNQPLTTVQWNIYYHLGLAHYLNGDYDMAREAYEPCLALSENPDTQVAVSDWLYMTYRKLGMEDEAQEVIASISPEWQMIENDTYFQRIMMYKGLVDVDSLLDLSNPNLTSLDLATQGYGVANYLLAEGDTTQAISLFEKIVEGENWPAFGYIAAEAELARLR